MSYKYSICHPELPEIEHPKSILEKDQVIELVKNYPWLEELNKMNNLGQNQCHYNPSLDFSCVEDKISFCLTADNEKEELSFSLWYNRPVTKKSFFGLGASRQFFQVVDKWSVDLETSLSKLKMFLDKEYDSLERFMTS